MRTSAGVLSLLLVLSAFGQVAAPESFLDRGTSAFREGDYASAVIDLQAAAQGFMSSENMQRYVNTGKFEHLDRLEESLVYRALSQSRLGREGDARETILQLISVERIAPTYERLQIAEAKDFDMLVASLVPAAKLPPNMHAVTPAAENATALPVVVPATPSVTTAEGTGPLPAAVRAEPAAAGAAPAPEQRLVTQRTVAEERAQRERLIAELVVTEREQIEKEAAARIAEECQTREHAAAARVAAAERRATTVETAAQQRIAALQNESQERLTVTEADAAARIAAAKKEADERVAAAQAGAQRDAEMRSAELQKETERRIAAERAAAEQATAARIAEAAASASSAYLTSLRQADAMADKGDLEAANALYSRVANSENAPREMIAEAAVGLYRTGSFRNSASAFKRLGMFGKGEEDLRYYNAVALFETGSYQAAKKELACALPFIHVTEDVARYRTKIEQTASQQAMR